MEDNVALDSSKQKKFIKSIKGIKKLLKEEDTVPKRPVEKKVKDGKKQRKIRERGLVYLSHIPHGFYENEMTQYFKQFGKVTNVRVIRSKRTGMSKGHAFVEFGQPAVAEIVAETMNNYLMGKRLIKAECIPHEKQKRNAMRKNWNAQNNPATNFRIKFKKEFNDVKTDEQHLKKAKRLMKNLKQTKEKLKGLGIDYDFFNPVDIPESLLDPVEVKNEEVEKDTVKPEKKVEKKKLSEEELPPAPVKVAKKNARKTLPTELPTVKVAPKQDIKRKATQKADKKEDAKKQKFEKKGNSIKSIKKKK